MKYIKKVDVTQLVTNTGTIIDSMSSGDDQHTNAPSIDAVKNYVENYSTTEQKIGTWIDGKPLYRKTINDITGNESGSWKSISFVESNVIDTIVKMTGTIKTSTGNVFSIPFSRMTDNSYSNREYVFCVIVPSTGNFNIVWYHPSNNTIYNERNFIMNIYYTKITD